VSGLSDTLGLVGDRPAEEVLRRLTLDVTRRLDGMLHGDFEGLVPGRGSELGETRTYEPGDDVRRIDWNVTARMQSPHIRETIADRELETWMLVDRSSSLDFGTVTCEKRDLALAAAAGVGLVTARGGNRVGGMILRGASTETVPPRQGRKHLLGLLSRIQATPRADESGPAELDTALRRLGAMAPRRGLVVVVSDFAGHPDRWRTALGTVALRHSVLCISVVDPRELELPPVGVVEFLDPTTGATREVNTDDAGVRARFAQLAADHQAAVARAVRGAGADHLVLRTDGDWLMELARHVGERRRRAETVAVRSPR
jgi:uncharacterized protein (DUF58 family)